MRPSDPSDRPARVLVTGAGGPAAVSFMQAVATARPSCGRSTSTPTPPASTSSTPTAGRWSRAATTPTSSTRAADLCRAARHRRARADRGHRAAAAGRRRRGELRRGRAPRCWPTAAATLATCLDKWALYRGVRRVACRCPRPRVLDAGLDAASLACPVDRQAPARAAGRAASSCSPAPPTWPARPRDGSLIVQELLPGVEHSLDVLAYADGGVAAVVPRTRLKVDSGIAVAGCTVVDPASTTSAGAWRRGDRAHVGGQRAGQAATPTGGHRLLEVNPRFPGSHAADRGQRRRHAAPRAGRRARARPSPSGVVTARWRWSARWRRDLPPGRRVRRHRRRARPRLLRERVVSRSPVTSLDVPLFDRGSDLHVHSTFSDGASTVEENLASAAGPRHAHPRAGRPRAPGTDLGLRRSSPPSGHLDGTAGLRSPAAASRPRSSTPPGPSTCRTTCRRSTTCWWPTTSSPRPDGPMHPRDAKAALAAGALRPTRSSPTWSRPP